MLRLKKALSRDASLFAEPVEGTKAVECVVEANGGVSHRDEGGTLAFFEAWDAQACLVNLNRRDAVSTLTEDAVSSLAGLSTGK